MHILRLLAVLVATAIGASALVLMVVALGGGVDRVAVVNVSYSTSNYVRSAERALNSSHDEMVERHGINY
jgi:hypothetical protein